MLESLAPAVRAAFAERFASHYAAPEGCWLWTGAINEKGYGVVGLPGGRTTKAHRVAYEIQFGPFDPARCVLHRCDTPACVRPDHLFLGSRADNNQDMRQKGRAVAGGRRTPVEACRYARGERHGNAVLTADKVTAMRDQRSAGDSFSTIAARFGVGLTTAYKAIEGITWKSP